MNTKEKSFEELKDLISDINLLLITANDIETFHVRQVLSPIPQFGEVIRVPHQNHTYFLGVFGQYLAIHVQCGNMGSIGAGGAILTIASSIDYWQPKVVLMIGVAMGALNDKQKIGDVLVSERIIAYENQRLGAHKGRKRIVQRGDTVLPGAILLDRFKHCDSWQCQLEDGSIAQKFLGSILSGEKLIDNLKLRNQILKVFPTAIGAEMEGAGVFAACRNKRISEWILVKGICDYGDGDKGTNKKVRQNLAAQCATSLCLAVFQSRVSLSAVGLTPITHSEAVKNNETTESADSSEKEILRVLETKESEKKMHTPIQSTVSAFLDLNPYQKATIISEVGIDLASLIHLSPHEMDREFFRQVQADKKLPALWSAINKIKPFESNTNPFL